MYQAVKLDRYLARVEEYEKYPVQKGKVLLYGSSFFTTFSAVDTGPPHFRLK